MSAGGAGSDHHARPERQAVLREALRDAVEATRSQGSGSGPSRRPARRGSATAWGALTAGVLLLGWIWVARPAWVFGEPPAAPTPAVVAARARYAIYIQRVRVEDHLRRVGRLPDGLDALGTDPGVRVQLMPLADGHYELRADVAGTPLVYHSRMDADSFLGDALAVLRNTR